CAANRVDGDERVIHARREGRRDLLEGQWDETAPEKSGQRTEPIQRINDQKQPPIAAQRRCRGRGGHGKAEEAIRAQSVGKLPPAHERPGAKTYESAQRSHEHPFFHRVAPLSRLRSSSVTIPMIRLRGRPASTSCVSAVRRGVRSSSSFLAAAVREVTTAP